MLAQPLRHLSLSPAPLDKSMLDGIAIESLRLEFSELSELPDYYKRLEAFKSAFLMAESCLWMTPSLRKLHLTRL